MFPFLSQRNKHQKNNQKEAEIFNPTIYSQDSGKSLLKQSGTYDFDHLSQHELDVVRKVIKETKIKYPTQYTAIGLANETYCILYKPRKVLFQYIISLYEESENPFDWLAVAIAFESKGSAFRKNAIFYFEKAMDVLRDEDIKKFSSHSPLRLYTSFSKIYEMENEYDKAIFYTKKAQPYSSSGNVYFLQRLNDLQKDKESGKVHRARHACDEHPVDRSVRLLVDELVSTRKVEVLVPYL